MEIQLRVEIIRYKKHNVSALRVNSFPQLFIRFFSRNLSSISKLSLLRELIRSNTSCLSPNMMIYLSTKIDFSLRVELRAFLY